MKISLLSLCICFSVAVQSESFEKQAISTAQRTLASNLDAKLPNRSFGSWFSELIGQEAGIVWQLAECGSAATTEGNGPDVLACAEATVLLAGGDKVIVGISVGTFKKGLTGEPTFMGAVIDSGDRLYQIRQLSDLPGTLRIATGASSRGVIAGRRPGDSPAGAHAPKGISIFPDLEADLSQALVALSTNNPPIIGENYSSPRFQAMDEESVPPPPSSKRNSGELVGASIVSSVRPVYPRIAKSMGASGKVDVRVVISEMGRVVEASAVSGPMTLQGAAVAAARQWVYKPATRNGIPVRTETIVTFTFDPREP